MRRVVITGIGIVSCLGNNQDEVYNSLLNSKSGISFADEYKEHKTIDIRKGYLGGRYGSIPILGKLHELNWNEYATNN